MILLSIYIEFSFQTVQFLSEDQLTQTDCLFKYLYVFGRISIVGFSIFFSSSGMLSSVKDIFIMIIALLVTLAHYSYIPFKNFTI